jgi:hypothetical protein
LIEENNREQIRSELSKCIANSFNRARPIFFSSNFGAEYRVDLCLFNSADNLIKLIFSKLVSKLATVNLLKILQVLEDLLR